MKSIARALAPIGFVAFALTSTMAVSSAPANAAVGNSRDCKLYGICDESIQPSQGYMAWAGAAPVTSSSVGAQADWNSHDCRHYGICPQPPGSNQNYTTPDWGF